MKTFVNMTQGVVRVAGDATMSLESAGQFSVAGFRKIVFMVRTYNVGTFGELFIESSNQVTDGSSFLWKSVGSVTWTTSATDSNKLFTIVADEDELFSYVRWRFVFDNTTSGTNFEITGYGLD